MKVLCAPRLAGAALIVALGSSHAAAQWVTTNGPAGAQANAFTTSGTSLFAGTAGGGVFVAAGNYTRWVAVNNGLTNRSVLSLASGINEFGDRMLLAGTQGGGVFWLLGQRRKLGRAQQRTEERHRPRGGRHSRPLFRVRHGPLRGNGRRRLSFQQRLLRQHRLGGRQQRPPKQPRPRLHLLLRGRAEENDGLGSHDAVVGTAGGGAYYAWYGAQWWAKNTGLTNANVAALAANSPGWGPIFAGTLGGGVFRSNGIQGAWTAVNNGLTNKVVQAVATTGTNVFAGTSGGGVFVSTNNGGSWVAVNQGLPNLAVTALTSMAPMSSRPRGPACSGGRWPR